MKKFHQVFKILFVILICCTLKSSYHVQAFGNVKVAVIDSGVNKISKNIADGFCTIDKTNNTVDNKGHGTYIASIILKIAPTATIVPIKATELNMDLPNQYIIDGIYKAVDDYQCDVINISIGMPHSEELKTAITYAINKGAIIVSAVGNDGEISYKKGKIYYPAGYENVIGVGSVKDNYEISNFSQNNESVFITTNGENIKTDVSFEHSVGTSFSAAKITGYAAILKGYNIKFSTPTFKKLLMENVIDKGDKGYDAVYGYGILNEKEFLESLEKDNPVYVKEYVEKESKTQFSIYNGKTEKVTATLIKISNDKQVKSEKIEILPQSEIKIQALSLDECFLWQNSIFDIIYIKR